MAPDTPWERSHTGQRPTRQTAIHFMAKNTRQSAQADDTPDVAVQEASTADANGEHTPPETKPARTRRKKADAAPPTDAAPSEAPAEAPAPRPRRAPAARAPKPDAAETPPAAPPTEAPADEAPAKPRRTRAKKAEAVDAGTSETSPAESAVPERDVPADAAPAKPRRTRAKKAEDAAEATAAEPLQASTPEAGAAPEAAPPTRRRTRTTRSTEEPVASSDNLPDTLPPDAEAPVGQTERGSGAATSPNDRTEGPRDGGPRAERPYPNGGQNQAPQQRQGPPQQAQQQGQQQGPPRYDDDGEGGGRRRKKRNRNKNRGQEGGFPSGGPQNGYPNAGNQNSGNPNAGQPQQGGGGQPQQPLPPAEPFEGILELIGDKKFGFVREFSTSLLKGDNDPFMPPPLIQKYRLRDGVQVKGMVRPGRKGASQVVEVTEVMGGEPEAWGETPEFDDGLVVYPDEKLRLVTNKDDISMRVVDLVAPIGKGQRGLIVAPPRAGKTILIKQIAAGLSQNHPDVKLVALLIDERPEEVTDFRRNTNATVFASSNDYGEDNHVRVATIAFEYARRMVEQGHDVVILLDSLTRLGRTFNMFGANLSGRTMSGGLDARALLVPRKIFGAARNIENGGSLTIIATALVETGSRMDDVIFEEFKGTGNSEIVLDREMSEQRIYPAINIRKSGTRNEDRLVDPDVARQRHMLLRALNSRHPVEAMQALAKQLQLSASNEELLQALVPE